jgi:hypothetical protein
MKVPDIRRGNLDYFLGLKEFADANLDKVHRYLLDYEYDPRTLDIALETAEKAEMQRHSLNLEYPEVSWILERIADGFPLAEQEHWYEAYNSSMEDELKDGILIDRSMWPDRISAVALRQDYLEWAKDSRINSRFITGLKERVSSVLPYLRKLKRMRLDYVENGKRTIIQPVVYAFPSKQEILDYLSKKYGAIVSQAIEGLNVEPSEVQDFVMRRKKI